MRKAHIIIQARTSSQRLPGKVIRELAGLPMISQVIRRVKFSKYAEAVCLATTSEKEDDVLEVIGRNENVLVFRGDKEDVLSRYYFAAKELSATDIVRITGDCPLIDPRVLDEVVELYFRSGADYASNIHPPTYPDGLDVEVFSTHLLARSYKEAQRKYQREHVTPFMWEREDLFHIVNHTYNLDLSSLRWIVDEEKDLRFASEVYRRISPNEDGIFYMEDVLKVLREEEGLLEINAGISRNEGFSKSLKEEGLV